MNEFSILDAEIGEPDDGIRELTVDEVYTETITFDDNRTAEKVFLRFFF